MDLVILAAGMGSRFGGLKQLAGLGPQGQTLLEYSAYDARRAGFERIVFIIREAFRAEFERRVVAPIAAQLAVECVSQELDKVPTGVGPEVLAERVKPWGTGHAVWCARSLIAGRRCGVINADDFYGRAGLEALATALREGSDAVIVGYRLGATLSANGGVSRGVLEVDAAGMLTGLAERHGLRKVTPERAEDAQGRSYGLERLVSMNCLGFGGGFLPVLEAEVQAFFAGGAQGECYLPSVYDRYRAEVGAVRVVGTESEWMGVTYAADSDPVRARLAALTAAGDYPPQLG